MQNQILTPTATLSDQLRTACLLEAAAPKLGNVHPGASFKDLRFEDFLISANVVAPILAKSQQQGVGDSIREAAIATRDAVRTNTNLGILLLLAPLAAVEQGSSLTNGITRVLKNLTQQDTEAIYEAIRIAQPGGMGEVDEQDVARAPLVSILEAMQLAANRDQIAKQYVTNFHDVLATGIGFVKFWKRRATSWEDLIVGLQLTMLAEWPDSLITRKNGLDFAIEVSARAKVINEQDWLSDRTLLVEFDQWLREDGHQRNPGTTADLIAATLFAAIREGIWQPPSAIQVTVQ